MTSQADIGLIGLAVMGENLALNIESRGFTVAVFNRTTARVDEFMAGRAQGKRFIGCHSVEQLVASLSRPRKIMLMIQAGAPVDAVIEQLRPHLAPGDILIDGGNSYFLDTRRRMQALEAHGLLYLGVGVSGGEEGALHGPSIMPGGSAAAWPAVQPIFQAIAAKVAGGVPCCDWVGADGAGHYVKMVHNGIEYGDMQLIAEAYHLMRGVLGMSAEDCQPVFSAWNEGELDSYLIEITADILTKHDERTGRPMVDMILDRASQKGTGRWTAQSALELGIPAPTLAEAVFARALSMQKDERLEASATIPGPAAAFEGDRAAFLEAIREALYASKICTYAQGFALLHGAAAHYGWQLHYGSIALMWRGGCIIRARFLDRIFDAYLAAPALPNLLLAPYFQDIMARGHQAWREVVAVAARHGVPLPAFSSALAYFDGYRSAQLPANLIQAQRDYFGAHTYERVDEPGVFVHAEWTALP